MEKIIMTSIRDICFRAFKAKTAVSDSIKLKNKWTVEIDPLVPFILSGFGFHVFVSPKKLPRYNFVFGIIAHRRLPDFIIDNLVLNKDMGWICKINQGDGLEFEYYLNEFNN